MLSAGLLIGSSGGAIAWADTESSGSSAQSQGADAPSAHSGSANAPAKKVADTLRTTLHATVHGVTRTLRSIQALGKPHSTGSGPAATKPAVTNTGSNDEGSDPIAADPSLNAADRNEVESDQMGVASDQTVVASESTAVPPVTNPVSTVVGPLANSVITVVNVFASLPATAMALPTSPTPLTDVIAAIQEMLTSVTNVVVAIAELPSNLYSLLSVPTVTATTTVLGGVNADAIAPLLGIMGAPSAQLPPISLAAGMALRASIAPLGTLSDIATTGLTNRLPASGIAPPARDVVVQSGFESFLEHTVSALFVPASLSALAAVALPGVGGLLIICGLGMRIGYRQAKALLEVRRAGIASFAGPGPLGVVRSGSLIALRPRALGARSDRTLRVVRTGTSPAACVKDQAA